MRERGEKGDRVGEREGRGRENGGERNGKGGEREGNGREKEGRGNGEGRENKVVAKYIQKRTKLHHFLTIFSGACPETPLAKHHFSKINLNSRPPPPRNKNPKYATAHQLASNS